MTDGARALTPGRIRLHPFPPSVERKIWPSLAPNPDSIGAARVYGHRGHVAAERAGHLATRS